MRLGGLFGTRGRDQAQRGDSSLIAFWDVDGTLVENDPSGVDLYLQALSDVVGEVRLPNPPSRHGKTDRQIVREYLRAANVDDAELARVTHRLEVLSQVHYRSSTTARRVLPGIAKALTAAESLGFRNALFTGNSRRRAEAKLDGAGLEREIFDWDQSFFGSTHENRPALARHAARSVRRGVIIGDTPADGTAAQVAGFAFIAVATGVYSEIVLRAGNPVACLPDLNRGYSEFVQALMSICDDWRRHLDR